MALWVVEYQESTVNRIGVNKHYYKGTRLILLNSCFRYIKFSLLSYCRELPLLTILFFAETVNHKHYLYPQYCKQEVQSVHLIGNP